MPTTQDTTFKIRNTLVVNTSFWANSTGIYFGASPTLALNSTNFTGTSLNSNNLNSVPASSYVNTSGSYSLSGIITFSANALFSAGLRANGSFGSANQLLSSNSTGGIYWATSAPSAFTDTTNATNISTGTLNSARVGVPGSDTQMLYNSSSSLAGAAALTVLAGAANNITIKTQANAGIGLTVVAGTSNCTANLVQIANNTTILFAVNATGVIVGNGAGLTSVPSNVLLSNVTNQTISGGATVTSANLGISNGSVNNFTINSGTGPLQYLVANIATTTITAPSNDGYSILFIINGSNSPSLTFSGFTVPAANTGDPYVNTSGNKYMVPITRINGTSTYYILACQ